MSGNLNANGLVDPKFIGIPYRLKGRRFDGADCIGLVILWFQEHGYDVGNSGSEPYAAHWTDEDPQLYLKKLMEYGDFVDFRQMQPNDVVMILNHDPDREKDSKRVDSIGVVVDGGHFLATTKEKGSQVGTFTVANLRYFVGAIRPLFDEEKRFVKKIQQNNAEPAPAAA